MDVSERLGAGTASNGGGSGKHIMAGQKCSDKKKAKGWLRQLLLRGNSTMILTIQTSDTCSALQEETPLIVKPAPTVH